MRRAKTSGGYRRGRGEREGNKVGTERTVCGEEVGKE